MVKEALWKGWTDYTYDKVTLTTKTPAEFIYIVFRYAQPLGTTVFFTYLMDDPTSMGLYRSIYRRHPNPPRTRYMTFEGAWKNEAKAYNIKLEVTKDNITGFLDGTQQFTIPDDNLVDGRIGLGVWGADARFDDLKVFGPGGPTAVDPAGKVATTWSKIKAQF